RGPRRGSRVGHPRHSSYLLESRSRAGPVSTRDDCQYFSPNPRNTRDERENSGCAGGRVSQARLLASRYLICKFLVIRKFYGSLITPCRQAFHVSLLRAAAVVAGGVGGGGGRGVA